MDTSEFLFSILEKCGVIDFHRYDSAVKNRLQSIFVSIHMCLLAIYATLQSCNVLIRGTRYFPELVQTVSENLTMWYLLFMLYYFNSLYQSLVSHEVYLASFSNMDSPILQACNRKAKIFLLGFLIVVGLAIGGSFFELLIPLSESELDIRRHVYRTKHPERRLPFNTHIPYVDESESWTYEILFAFQFYLISWLVIYIGCVVSLIPMTMMMVRGHYEVLSGYIQLLGHEHRDSLGNPIVYTNIEKNEYTIRLYSSVVRGNRERQMRMLREKVRRQRLYEQDYVRQILIYHQKLLIFQDKVSKYLMQSDESHLFHFGFTMK